MGIEGYWKHRKANSFGLLIPENIKNHRLKVALDDKAGNGYCCTHTVLQLQKQIWDLYITGLFPLYDWLQWDKLKIKNQAFSSTLIRIFLLLMENVEINQISFSLKKKKNTFKQID